LRRWLYFALGWLCFALGVAGAFLPVLPTTPFMLLSLWALSRSSQRFHDWLYNHRLFGPPLQRWRRERALPWSVKLLAFTGMAASLAYLLLVARPRWWWLAGAGAIIAVGAIYVARIPSRPAQRRA
jgi:uncharacterized membrane protein YbaN (DUF454 family)